jgi:hypothetical protein
VRRRTSLAAALAVGTAWLAAACGIPTGRDPEVIGEAPTDFGESSGTSAERFEPTAEAEVTVANFLKAAAGDPAGRDDRLNLFTASGAEQFSAAGDGIRLLDGIDISFGEGNSVESAIVTVTGSVVGNYYLDDGSVRMNSTPSTYEETFTLQRDGGLQDPWEIATLPLQVVLDYDQFLTSYTEAPLYFRAGDSQLLVPDLRWIYDDLEADVGRRILLDWLLQGPSDFTSQSARSAIPDDSDGEVAPQDDTVQIDLTLSEPIDDTAVQQAMAAQIAWTLGLGEGFVLTADGETIAEGALEDWRSWNAIPADLPQTAYFIAEERVWEYTGSEVTTTSREHPWVGFTAEGLREVAIGPADQLAAVVAGAGGDVLQVGPTNDALGAVPGLGTSLADPQWHPESAVLVVSDGVPTVVNPNTRAVVHSLTSGEAVTAMALSADGRRLAYVEGGHVWVAPLTVDADGKIQAGEPERIGYGIEEVTDVAWSSENYLWVAGKRDDDTLFQVALDNSRTDVQAGTAGLVFSQIGANPADPVESIVNRGEPVLAVANATLYRVHSSGPEGVRNGNVAVGGTAPFTVLQ